MNETQGQVMNETQGQQEIDVQTVMGSYDQQITILTRQVVLLNAQLIQAVEINTALQEQNVVLEKELIKDRSESRE